MDALSGGVAETLQGRGHPTTGPTTGNRWDRYHDVRVALIIAAFALLVSALA